ncbi:MAG: DNA replication and repair protein RecF [Desulfuromonadaceae bacterium]|nr:DNA replication and repair protein RecF [Desulfuromonadaceae bacterium]
MYIENISIKNFRNISDININPCKKINLIIGNNAQGKTNFIEAIYFTSLLKSFRTQKISELIREDEDSSYLKFEVINNKVNLNIEVYFNSHCKKLKINKKKAEKYYFKYLNTVIFFPEEVNYINNYPMFRRNLLDRSIFYNDFDYINIYKKYYRCLKQRNTYLKNNHKENDCWKNQLIKYGSEIIRKRLNYIDKINNYFMSDLFIKTNKEEYLLSYSKKYPNLNSIEDHLREEFSRKNNRERILGYTLVGPHKDDLQFYINNKPADTFASQGQKRSLIISFKTAQILDYKNIQGHYPVLILDDMTSELDRNRKNILLENLLNNSGQVFITSTDSKEINCSEQTKVFRINNGEISSPDC